MALWTDGITVQLCHAFLLSFIAIVADRINTCVRQCSRRLEAWNRNLERANDFKDRKGNSAIANGHGHIASWVLQNAPNEADFNAGDKDGRTPLELALKNNCMAATEILVMKGATLTDTLGNSPLHWAVAHGQEEVASWILRNATNEADINASNKDGQTPLTLALRNGKEGVAMLLIENGGSINSSSTKGWAPILLASGKGHEAVVKVLIEKGADVNIRSENGQTTLLPASWFGHEAVARLLVENGAAVNVSDDRGQTPLFLASRHDHEAIACFLVDNGADTDGL